MSPEAPNVRVAVLNYNGEHLVLRCLQQLERLDWPRDRLEVVVIDNGSTDASVPLIREHHPDVDILEPGRNLGFAEGNNLAMRDLEGIDYIALLNNDAYVEPGWLAALVRALESDAGLGAACPKIVFEPRFFLVGLEGPTFTPGAHDRRELSVRVSGIRVDGEDRWRDAQLVTGWHGIEHGGADEPVYRWMGAQAELRVPSNPARRPDSAEIRVASERETELTVRSDGVERSYPVGRSPTWIEIPLAGEPVDVIQNAGNVLVPGGWGADRAHLEVDRGQHDEPAEVFAWCGGSVLLRRRYLEEIGIFDPRYFIYYEDFDLSWRGRARGWRYVYVPDALVRHIHSATNVEGSAFFEHLVERNRLIVHVKNAPAGYAAEATARYVRSMAGHAVRDVVRPLRLGRRPQPMILKRRVRSFASFTRQLPSMLPERRRLRIAQTVPDDELLAWRTRR